VIDDETWKQNLMIPTQWTQFRKKKKKKTSGTQKRKKFKNILGCVERSTPSGLACAEAG
jgi:hypothetical protein